MVSLAVACSTMESYELAKSNFIFKVKTRR